MDDFNAAYIATPFSSFLPLLLTPDDDPSPSDEMPQPAARPVMQVSDEILQGFPLLRELLRELDAQTRAVLLRAVQMVRYQKGDEVFRYGDCDEMEYFLVGGAVEMVAGDGREHTVQAGTDIAQQPLARLRPRQYTTRAASKTLLLQLERSLLKTLQDNVQQARQREQLHYGVEELTEVALEPEAEALMLFRAMRDEVRQGRYYLPDQPPAVANLRRRIKLGSSDIQELAKLTGNASALERCLLSAASSPLFGSKHPRVLCADALQQLSLPMASDLALAFVPALIQRQQQCADTDSLRHSMGVAAHAWWLAERTGLAEPCRALVLGLLHNAGMPWAMHYLKVQQVLHLLPDEEENLLPLLCRDVTGALLARWDVDDAYSQALPVIYDWRMVGARARAGLADLLQVARYLQLLSEECAGLPQAEHVSAVQRISCHEPQLLDLCFSKPRVTEILSQLRHILVF